MQRALQDEKTQLLKELASLKDQVAELKQKLQAQTDLRVEVEDRVKQLEGELAAERGLRLHFEGLAHERAALIAELRSRPRPRGWIG